MSGIKKLAGETFWYGGSSIAARFLNYLLTPYLTFQLSGADYGEMSLIYAAIPFFNVVFTYGFETAYFRFSNRVTPEKNVYDTAMISMIVTTILLTALCWFNKPLLGNLLDITHNPEFIDYTLAIVALDTIAAIPFAKLRQDNRPKKYAFVRFGSIIVTIAFTYFFISLLPGLAAEKESFWSNIYRENYEVGYVILANLIASGFTLLFLFRELFQVKFKFNAKLWVRMLIYAAPLLIAGFGGMINEVFNRIMLNKLAPVATAEAAKFETGMFSAVAKLAILITLFIQAFRMAAEPFFFKQAAGTYPQRTYARVMKFFVMTVSLMFLVVALYLDIWKYFIQKEAFWRGLNVVPVLLMANIFLGIYYNLSVWYKLTHQTMYGAWITLAGAIVTLAVNYLFIPMYGYVACAWGTFAAYGSMMVISYLWGQKNYHIPYARKKLLSYLGIAVAIYLIHSGAIRLFENRYFSWGLATFLILLYARFLTIVEHKEFERLPMIGRYFKVHRVSA